MTEPVGPTLKAAREERGLSISEVAHSLKFAPRQLEALEQERFDLLPGGTFVRGMVRSYARLLKLEADPLVEGIAGHFHAPDAGILAARYSQPVPFSDSARRSTFVYLGVSVAVLGLGSLVAYQWYRDHRAATQVAMKRAPEKRAVAAAQPAPQVLPAAPKPQPKTPEEPPRAEAVVKVASAAPVVSSAASAPMKIEKPPVAVSKVATGSHRLVIRCEEEAWIEVKDANDRMLVSSLNPKGCERVVQSRGPLTLVIGNAQHVRILHNDRPVDLAPHTKLSIARFTLP